jgi:hypothetical protein
VSCWAIGAIVLDGKEINLKKARKEKGKKKKRKRIEKERKLFKNLIKRYKKENNKDRSFLTYSY